MRRALFVPALLFVLAAGCGAAQALDKAKVDAVTLAADQFVVMAKGSHFPASRRGRPMPPPKRWWTRSSTCAKCSSPTAATRCRTSPP